MAKLFRYSIIICFGFLISCQLHQTSVRLDTSEQAVDDYLRQLQPHQVDQVMLDYMADCKIRIKTPEEAVSGSCKITVTTSQQLKVEIYAPIGGLVMSLYMDREIIQLLIRSDKVLYQMKNTAENRKRRLQFVNLTVAQLQEVLWGRKITKNNTTLTFILKNGRPFKIENQEGDRLIAIQYSRWLDYRGVAFPKIMDIQDFGQNVSVKLVVTKLELGYAARLKINKIPPDYERKS